MMDTGTKPAAFLVQILTSEGLTDARIALDARQMTVYTSLPTPASPLAQGGVASCATVGCIGLGLLCLPLVIWAFAGSPIIFAFVAVAALIGGGYALVQINAPYAPNFVETTFTIPTAAFREIHERHLPDEPHFRVLAVQSLGHPEVALVFDQSESAGATRLERWRKRIETAVQEAGLRLVPVEPGTWEVRGA